MDSVMGIQSSENNATFFGLYDQEDEEEDTHIFDKASVRITLGILYTIVFCFCVLGNLSVILVVTLHWKMRSIAKFCMGNLACANLCVGIFCVFQNLSTYLTDSWLFGNFLCKMYYFTTSWAQAASILILVLTCVERYLVILHPFKCRQFLTMRKLRFIVAGIWLLSAGISSPRLYYFSTVVIPLRNKEGVLEPIAICMARQTMYNLPAAEMADFILLFVLPLAIMGILYTRLGLFLSRADSVLRGSQAQASSKTTTTATFTDSHKDSIMLNSEVEDRGKVGMTRNTSHSDSSGFSSGSSESSEEKRQKRQIRRKKKNDRKKNYERARYGDGPNAFPDEDYSEETEMAEFPIKSRLESDIGRGESQGRKKCLKRDDQLHSSCKISGGTTARTLPVVSRSRSTSRKAVVRMLIVIVLTFAFCNLPFHVRKLCQNYLFTEGEMDTDWSRLFLVSTFLLVYTNCAVNPILYAFMSQSFRESFKDLILCRWRKRFVRASNCSV